MHISPPSGNDEINNINYSSERIPTNLLTKSGYPIIINKSDFLNEISEEK